ncbi:MAG TPA: presqualene diphosphate synthase HpnD [Candidatus Eisenbacteria bacterium]|nr:presqualene diphosphate synthase HpnD [Candidatus Eisenbacteria bacterium]
MSAPVTDPIPAEPVPPDGPAPPPAAPTRRTNFGVAFAILPREQREAIRAVHAWSRAVDDSVDEESDHRRAEERLAAWRDDLAAIFEAGPRAPESLRLAPFVRRFGIPRAYFEALIDGVAMDLARERYPDFESLRRYCWHVASVVGLICLRIFGDAEERARGYAEHLGVALQLTNILRDVGTDAAHGRIYLPAEDLRRFDVAEEAIERGERSDAFRRLMRFQAERARSFFETAEREMKSLDRRRYVAAEIMRGVYRRLLERIEGSDFDVFAREIRVRRMERVWIAATTAASIRLRG